MTCWVLLDLSLNWPAPLQKCQHEAAKKQEHKVVNQAKDDANKRCTAAQCKSTLSNDNNHSSKHVWQKVAAFHARTMGMMCCGNHAFISTGTIQTIASSLVLQWIALATNPLKTVKVTMTNTTFNCSRNHSGDCHDHRDHNYDLTGCACKDQIYYTKPCYFSRAPSHCLQSSNNGHCQYIHDDDT